MPYRYNPSYKDQYYHVYNRGNNFEKIFFVDKNYHYFLSKVVDCFGEKIELIAYCLMPNHYHLLVLVRENGALEKAMQRISNGYTKAINKAYNRTGHLFQGPFKNKLIPNNEYLIHLSRYIHLNPLRAGLVRKPEEWKYSSYNEIVNQTSRSFVKASIVTEQFGDIEAYKRFVVEYDEDQSYFIRDMLFK